MGRKGKKQGQGDFPSGKAKSDSKASDTAVPEEVKVDRDIVFKFLTSGIEKMTSQATREMLRDTSSGLPAMTLVNETQDKIWDDFGVRKEAGRDAVEMIEAYFPDDSALPSLRAEFGKTSDAAYWQCLEDRRPSVLETEKRGMPRNALLDFYTATSCKIGTSEVQERLLKHIAETGAFPEPVVNEVLGEVLELLGFEKEHGQRCFKDVLSTEDFQKDREAIAIHSKWESRVDSACLSLLHQYRKEGGELKVDTVVSGKLRELQAKEDLDAMSREEQSLLLEKNATKVDIFRKLPAEGRQRYLDKLPDEEKLELAKTEILMVTIMQHQHQQSIQARINQSQNVD